MGITRGYMAIVYLVNSVQITWTDFTQFKKKKKKKKIKFERSFTQECKYCCGFLCIFPYFMLSSPICAK